MAADLPKRKTPQVRRLAVLATATALLSLTCPPAHAAPTPRSEEWWFTAWQIADKVWPLAQGEGVTVGVIDTGVEARLPELKGVVVPGGGSGSPHGGDGRVDSDAKNGGHGTGMAALITGQGSGSGMVGIAPKSRILPVVSSTFGIAKDIRYAVDRGADVINMSEGIPADRCPIGIQSAVSYAVQHDVVLVAGAGNDPLYDSNYAPANCRGVLTVGGVDANLVPWEKSTPGGNVNLAGPAVSVGSIGKTGAFLLGLNGTSQAAALTSGVVALMRSRFPHMSGREIVQRMLATARDVGPKGWDKKTGYGALIPYKALTANVPKNAPNPVYASLTGQVARNEASPQPTALRHSAIKEKGGQHTSTYAILAATATLIGVATFISLIVHRRRQSRNPNNNTSTKQDTKL
ncbi:S8 family serine peptidase [Actinomadura violacea]|uniref:S8 family serine peptidase n=1 Tax=Actinomadura violacea TaxID=2819934 RepID=A0ABS3RP54_9ACTN|nr:S8 family serine peptidase [Actinomadura violacea]MBO2458525.1 S8 family serine peptidase [Actinomadura violacea]